MWSYFINVLLCGLYLDSGWSGGAMAMGNLPVPKRPAVWMIVGQGPTALPVLCKILFAFSGEVAKMRLLLNM